jgi:hypothetical protein
MKDENKELYSTCTKGSETMNPVSFRSVILTLAAAALAASLGCSPESDTESMRYDPEPYRELIQKIEAMLNKAEAVPGDGATLYKYSSELAGALGKNIDNHMIRETVQNRLMSFGEAFTAQEDAGMTVDLEAGRASWKNLRADLFRSADWYK